MSERQAKPIDLSTIDLGMVESRIDRTPESGCWHWVGGKSAAGYGYVSRGRSLTKVPAHRVVYTMRFGQIPNGLPLDHLCRNRRCVNPSHLEPVTTKENNRRGFGASGVHARQTHCIRGHEFSDENTYRSKTGSRACRTCARESGRPSGWQRARDRIKKKEMK